MVSNYYLHRFLKCHLLVHGYNQQNSGSGQLPVEYRQQVFLEQAYHYPKFLQRQDILDFVSSLSAILSKIFERTVGELFIPPQLWLCVLHLMRVRYLQLTNGTFINTLPSTGEILSKYSPLIGAAH